MIYAIDFDGTIVKHDYPHLGEPVPGALEGMRELVEEGHQIILYTMRDGRELAAAVAYLEGAEIPLFGVNENPDQTWSTSPKVYAHRYIDDSALGCPLRYPLKGSGEKRPWVDWDQVMWVIRTS